MRRVDRRKQGSEFKAQLDALLDAAVDAIILIGEDAQITHFNPAAERMFGYAENEVIGQNVKCLMPEPYRGEHDGYVSRYLKTGQAKIIGIGREVIGRRKDGSTFPLELSVGEVKQQANRGFVGIIRDISLRKEYEDQLRLQEEELRLIFESAPTAIVTLSDKGRLLTGNRAWHDLSGFTSEGMIELSWRDFVHPDDCTEFERGLESLLGGEREVWRAETRLRARDLASIHARIQVGVIRVPDGARFFILELVDMTGQALAEREAASLRENLAHITRLKTMGEMATGIAHELNQPLTAIATYAQASQRLLSTGKAQLPEMLEVMQKIYSQAERAGEVIRRLRAMLAKRDSQQEAVACDDLIGDIVRLAELDLYDTGTKIKLDIDRKLPLILVDRVQIQQVILNLLRNAMEAMTESASGDEILVTVELASNRMIEISISDRGPGVADQVKLNLFDPFYTTKPHGLGMGLAICRSIAESHGGSLGFNNNRYGGATFTLRLPVSEESDS